MSAETAAVARPEVSVLLPAFNEADNLEPVVDEVIRSLEASGHVHEVVVVDDGSTDATRDVCGRLAKRYPQFRAVRLRRNSGKSAALQVGFRTVAGDAVVLMDADGQDDPAELPRLLGALDQGMDLVTGRRSTRQDRLVKRVTSRLYNRVTALVTGVPGRDFNSGLKAMRRSVVEVLDIYGELHRYIPVLANWAGFRVGELDVTHRPRLHGESKFGHSRFWRGFLDLFTVKFLTTYTARPFHLFGGLGIGATLTGGVILVWMALERAAGERIGDRPALLLGVLLVLVGVQLVSLGLLAELVIHYRQTREERSLVEHD